MSSDDLLPFYRGVSTGVHKPVDIMFLILPILGQADEPVNENTYHLALTSPSLLFPLPREKFHSSSATRMPATLPGPKRHPSSRAIVGTVPSEALGVFLSCFAQSHDDQRHATQTISSSCPWTRVLSVTILPDPFFQPIRSARLPVISIIFASTGAISKASLSPKSRTFTISSLVAQTLTLKYVFIEDMTYALPLIQG